MGFSEKIEQMANEKERERGIKDINRLFSYLGGCDLLSFILFNKAWKFPKNE
jgi:hypothetical protein